MLIYSLVLRMHQEIHTQPSETSEGTCLPPVLFLSPPFVFQPQQMAVQSSKFVPRVTFSLEKGRSLVTVTSRPSQGDLLLVVLSKFVLGCSFWGLNRVAFLGTVTNLKVSETDLESAPWSFESCGVLARRVGFERTFQALNPVVRLCGRGGIIFGIRQSWVWVLLLLHWSRAYITELLAFNEVLYIHGP